MLTADKEPSARNGDFARAQLEVKRLRDEARRLRRDLSRSREDADEFGRALQHALPRLREERERRLAADAAIAELEAELARLKGAGTRRTMGFDPAKPGAWGPTAPGETGGQDDE